MEISSPGKSAGGWTERLDRLHESRAFVAVIYAVAALVIAFVALDTGFQARELDTVGLIAVLILFISAGFLLIFSLFELVAYFIFMPSIAKGGHVFSRVHSTHLIHPLTTAIILGLAGLCILTGSTSAWIAWSALLVLYLLQTALIMSRIRREHLTNGWTGPGSFLLFLHLIVGGELVTLAAGARPLSPWKLDTLPADTWIVDVRTKPEFYWNRLEAAENYPWGVGVIEAAKGRSKDTPVLVTCLSGHRSPSVALMIRRLGFKTVYNLNWGILYLILLERGRKRTGPFSLTRPHRDPDRRGEDLKPITFGYVTCAVLSLIVAPIEAIYWPSEVPILQQIIGAVIGLGGLALGLLSFKALGRNFRVFGAPRRSGTLITSGIYTYIRHPMYIGTIMAVGGYVLAFGSLIAMPLWLGVTIFYLVKTVKEERLLTDKYPEYEEYCKHTWKFIPYIY
jgi:protein-S-isoprenylcysteine O-methyltransferase Ste14/rhodanese-related sulfurtransferase